VSEELWKKTLVDKHYEVSSYGRVRSCERIVRCGAGVRTVRERILTPFIAKTTGYLQVNLSKRKRYNIHRLVASVFVEKESGCDVVNHLNGEKTDNRACNIEWTTHSGNHKHAFKHLGKRPTYLGKFGRDHATSKAVIATDIITGKERYFECALDAAKKHGFESGAISRCCNGLSEFHKGNYWRFADERRDAIEYARMAQREEP